MSGSTCQQVRKSFSGYLDGAISGREMQEISAHMDRCSECSSEFADWRAMQSLLGAVGPVKAPVDLGLRLRVAISQESSRRQSWRDAISVRWDNLIRPMVVQVSAGMAAAVVLLGGIALLLGVVTPPSAVLANDEPLGAMTAPHFRYSAGATGAIKTPEDMTIVVAALVNEKGQVYDYQVLSGEVDGAVRMQLMTQLLGEVFEPAKVFGAPARGRVIQTFAGVSVQG